MKSLIKKIILSVLPIKKSIIFESNPEFSCNAMPVFKEFMNRGLQNEFEIYWLVEDKKKYKDDENGIKYINYNETGIANLRKKYLLATSKALIFTNRFLTKYKSGQVVVNLMHGSPLKRISGYVENDTCDYVVTQSSFFNSEVSKILKVPIEKMIPLGYPRTDVFFNTGDVKRRLDINPRTKIIVWMPTFRKNKNSGVEAGSLNKLGVPLLNSMDKFQTINNKLKNNEIVLFIKLHPAEDTSKMEINNFSNILFISDFGLKKKGTDVYSLLADSDALLTDYSSVYYDYLLMNKPIGLVIDDLTNYDERNGFVYGSYKSFVKGTYIETVDDFLLFINSIADGVEINKEELEWARNRYIQYRDFDATKRVTDFIIGKITNT